ncbi:hypothetical protein TNCV_2965131 [Trichonephila clavipes]|nr:hypothetical protein TNCV_2965131 [Trichonephila clavipes]
MFVSTVAEWNDYDLVPIVVDSGVRVLVLLKTYCVEGLMHIISVKAQSTEVAVKGKFGKGSPAQMSSSSLD